MSRPNKWTYERCREEALKYNNKRDLSKNFKGCYNAINRNKWYKLLSHMPVRKLTNDGKYVGKYTKEMLFKISHECKHRSDFQDRFSGAHKAAKKLNLLDELFPEKFPNQPYFWNYDECKKISKEYKELTELKNTHIGAYNAMLRYNWLDEFYPYRKRRKSKFDYSTLTYDICKKTASKYDSPSKLMEGDRPIYNFSKENDWLVDFYDYKKPHPKRSYQDCKDLVNKYEYLNDFAKEQPGAHFTIRDNKWNDLLKNLKKLKKPKNYWTYERCREHALKHTERQKMDSTPRHYIYKNGWYDLLDHMDKKPSLGGRIIYSFEFEDNYVYVGLSYDPLRRRDSHLSTDLSSQVRKHIDRTNSKYKFRLLTESLEMKLASHEERRYIREYKKNGWIILNKNRGGSLGSKKKYTYQQCKDKVAEFKTLKEFTKQANGYYSRIKKEKWDELLNPLEKYRDYLGSLQYYTNKYPHVIDMLKRGEKNKTINEVTGLCLSSIWKVKKTLKEN